MPAALAHVPAALVFLTVAAVAFAVAPRLSILAGWGILAAGIVLGEFGELFGLPVWLQRLLLKALVRISIGDYRQYGLQQPAHKLFERHPAFGTDVLNYLRHRAP